MLLLANPLVLLAMLMKFRYSVALFIQCPFQQQQPKLLANFRLSQFEIDIENFLASFRDFFTRHLSILFPSWRHSPIVEVLSKVHWIDEATVDRQIHRSLHAPFRGRKNTWRFDPRARSKFRVPSIVKATTVLVPESYKNFQSQVGVCTGRRANNSRRKDRGMNANNKSMRRCRDSKRRPRHQKEVIS